MFFFGAGLIVLGVVYIGIGKAYARYHGWIFRSTDLKGYWSEVTLYFVLGAGLIAYSIYGNPFSK